MKRVTISMSDSAHKAITDYAVSHDVSFSKACSHLASIGVSSNSASDLTRAVMDGLANYNIHHYMTGNFDVPRSVIKRSVFNSISGFTDDDPLEEFAKIVGA